MLGSCPGVTLPPASASSRYHTTVSKTYRAHTRASAASCAGAASAQQPPRSDRPLPASATRRAQNAWAQVRLLAKHQEQLSPRAWVTGLCHLSELVGKAQVPRDSWATLARCLAYLSGPARQRRQGGGQQRVQPPLDHFSGGDVATTLWALARMQLQTRNLPLQFLRVAFSRLQACGDSLQRRDVVLAAWAAGRLAAQQPAALAVARAGVASLLQGQAQQLPGWPRRSLLVVMAALVRLQGELPNSAAVLFGLQGQLQSMQQRDVHGLLALLPRLGLRPTSAFLAAAMRASQRGLSASSCSELAGLLVAAGRLSYLPPAAWLLEVFDQLYWTADQLSLQQLAGVVWAFGRLQAVAVPQELLDRLLAFAGLQLAAAQQQVAQAASQVGARQARQRLLRQLQLLLLGAVGLRGQLSQQQRAACGSWLQAGLDAADSSSSAGVRLATCLYAGARLGRRLPPECCEQALQRLGQARPQLDHASCALGMWGVVGCGAQPSQEWVVAWLGACCSPDATPSELGMLLGACCRCGCQPAQPWLESVLLRVSERVARERGSTLVSLLCSLLSLQQAHALVGSGLLARMAARMEALELGRAVTVSSLRRFQLLADEVRRQAALV